MEAASGFEPEYNGFADRPLSHLGMPPRAGMVTSRREGRNLARENCHLASRSRARPPDKALRSSEAIRGKLPHHESLFHGQNVSTGLAFTKSLAKMLRSAPSPTTVPSPSKSHFSSSASFGAKKACAIRRRSGPLVT